QFYRCGVASRSSWVAMDSLVFVKTSDGGQTWQGGSIPMGQEPYASSICGLSTDTAWASGLDVNFANYVMHTTDGGQTWLRQLEDGFLASSSYVDFVHFWDAQNGIAVGDPAPSATEPEPFYEIYKTADGGENWTRVSTDSIPPPLQNEYGIGGVYSIVGDTIWFSTLDFTTNSGKRVYRSVNRGASWTVADNPAVWLLNFADGQYGVGLLDQIAVPAKIRLTTDGGITWSDLPPLNTGFGAVSSLAIIPQSHYLLAVGRSNLLTGPFITAISKDLGQSWMQIGDDAEHAGAAVFRSPAIGYAGEYLTSGHPTRMYKYAGDPLSGILSGKFLHAEISTFPNPASDFISVNVQTAQPAEILLLLNDASGRLVQREVFSKTTDLSHVLDLRQLAAGIFTLTISTKDGSVARQVVKQ
ncbi:MAG: T9SS type A sorting domain-containing protein, partial [Bacteroidota bacterium]